VTKSQAGGGSSEEQFDAIGHLVQRTSTGLIGATVVENMTYDFRNRLVAQTRPHLPGDVSQGAVQYGYDNLDRVINVLYADNTQTHRDYELNSSLDPSFAPLVPAGGNTMFITRDTDANGQQTFTFSDRDGQVLKILDAAGQETSYLYGAFGTLLSMGLPDFSGIQYSSDAYNCVFRCIRSGVPGASDHSFRRIRSETGAERRAG
jgi:YD repeat-containing protein